MGSRPEAIKLAPVVFALRREPVHFECILGSTGQQRDMIGPALAEFGLTADFDLNVMRAKQSLAGLTSRLMVRLDTALTRMKPDWVLVQGDTTSALAGAVAAFYRRVPVGHVEAGMRSFDHFSPFPEEFNRRAITQCASAHFAATELSAGNLRTEGVPTSSIRVTGNTGIDALLWMRRQTAGDRSSFPPDLLARLENRRLLFVTTHRRENFGRPLANICRALLTIARVAGDVVIVLPVHPNPEVKERVLSTLGEQPKVVLLAQQSYRTVVELMDRAHLVLTDSGGLQEEAPAFGKPVLVLRENTERPEGVDAGAAKLIGTDHDAIVDHTLHLLRDRQAYAAMARVRHVYGDGSAAPRIVEALARDPLAKDAKLSAVEPLLAVGPQPGAKA